MNKINFLAIYILAIILLMILPVNNASAPINHTYVLKLRADYLLHILIFFPWAILKPAGSNHIIWLAFGICFACFAEVIQYFTSYRSFNINDLLANVFGVLIGITSLLFNQTTKRA